MNSPQETLERINEFNKSFNLCLDERNRWVLRSAAIPWQQLQDAYRGGQEKQFRALLAACLIEAQYGTTDAETLMQIQESPYLQYFCGMKGYDGAGAPIDASELQSFRAELNDDMIARIKGIINAACVKEA